MYNNQPTMCDGQHLYTLLCVHVLVTVNVKRNNNNLEVNTLKNSSADFLVSYFKVSENIILRTNYGSKNSRFSCSMIIICF